MDKSKAIKLIKYFAIFLWLSLLVKTDSFYSVYLLIGGLATINLTKSKENGRHNTWLEYVFASILSISVVLANYPLILKTNDPKNFFVLSVFLALLVFFCGLIVFINIISIAKTLYLKTSKKQIDEPKKIFLISFLIFALIDLFIFFICSYPGSLTPDSIDEIGQILSGKYSNHHPFYFTILIYPFITIGINLFNDINIGVALYNIFQILVLSAAFSYSISTLYRIGVSKKLLLIITIIMALLPYNIIFSFTVWKDVLFGAAFLFFTVTLYRYFNKILPYKKSKLFQVILIFISGLAICLFRSNALIAMFISTVLFFIIFKKKYLRLGLILSLIIVSAFILKRPVLKAINVKQPDIIESLSIPSQQIIKSIKNNRDKISEDDISLINNIADTDKLTEVYNPTIHDPIKEVVRKNNNQEYIKEHALDFLSLYVRLGLQHPSNYVTAWIDITKGYWNGGYYASWNWINDVQLNDYGIKRKSNPILSDLFNNYISIFHLVPLFQPFISIGLAVWVLFLVLYRNILSKKSENIFLLLPIILTWATFLIATPVHNEFRYVYFLFTCLPFILVITIVNKSNILKIKRKATNEKR